MHLPALPQCISLFLRARLSLRDRGASRLAGLRQMRGQSADRRIAEQVDGGYIAPQDTLQFATHLHREQRMPAQIEKIIVDAHLRHAQKFRPDCRNLIFNRRDRRDVLAGGYQAIAAGRG